MQQADTADYGIIKAEKEQKRQNGISVNRIFHQNHGRTFKNYTADTIIFFILFDNSFSGVLPLFINKSEKISPFDLKHIQTYIKSI